MTRPTVIVTGASRGLGYAITEHLLTRTPGANVIAIARDTSSLKPLSTRYPDTIRCVTGDVCHASTTEEALEISKSYGSLDAVIFNAGVLDPVAKISDANAQDWHRLFDINLFSIVSGLPLFLPSLRTSHGRIIMVSSGASIAPYQGWSAYGCSKAALNHLVQHLGVEEPDVTSVSVRPGVIDTDMQKAIREQHGAVMSRANHDKFTGLKADGGLRSPEEVGRVIALMALSVDASKSGKFVDWTEFKDI